MKFYSHSLLGTLILSGIALAGVAQGADGAAIYNSKCKMCHGADGSGNPGMAKALKVTFRPLGSAEVQSQSDADIKKIITEGKGKMNKVNVSGGDLDEVVAYVRTLKK